MLYDSCVTKNKIHLGLMNVFKVVSFEDTIST